MARSLVSECVGTALLLTAVVGSGIMGDRLAPADVLPFVAAQVIGATAATVLFRWLVPQLPAAAHGVLVPHHSAV
jgi:glycerol uptake facilitator-like aquaporin